MSFVQNQKLPSPDLTVFLGCFPFGGVDTPVLHFVNVAARQSSRLCSFFRGVRRPPILLGFDFDQSFLDGPIRIAHSHPEVGEVTMNFSIYGRAIGDNQFFARPGYYRRGLVAVDHETKFQRRPVDYIHYIPQVLVGIFGFELSFIRHT